MTVRDQDAYLLQSMLRVNATLFTQDRADVTLSKSEQVDCRGGRTVTSIADISWTGNEGEFGHNI